MWKLLIFFFIFSNRFYYCGQHVPCFISDTILSCKLFILLRIHVLIIKNSCPATHSRFFHAQFVTETITRKSCLFTCTRQTVGKCCPIFWVSMYQDIHMCYICAWTGTDKNYWSLQRSLLTDGFFNVIFEHIPQFTLSSEKDLNHNAVGEKSREVDFRAAVL